MRYETVTPRGRARRSRPARPVCVPPYAKPVRTVRTNQRCGSTSRTGRWLDSIRSRGHATARRGTDRPDPRHDRIDPSPTSPPCVAARRARLAATRCGLVRTVRTGFTRGDAGRRHRDPRGAPRHLRASSSSPPRKRPATVTLNPENHTGAGGVRHREGFSLLEGSLGAYHDGRKGSPVALRLSSRSAYVLPRRISSGLPARVAPRVTARGAQQILHSPFPKQPLFSCDPTRPAPQGGVRVDGSIVDEIGDEIGDEIMDVPLARTPVAKVCTIRCRHALLDAHAGGRSPRRAARELRAGLRGRIPNARRSAGPRQERFRAETARRGSPAGHAVRG